MPRRFMRRNRVVLWDAQAPRAAASRLPSARSSAARMVWPSSMSRAARMPPSPLARPRATSSSGQMLDPDEAIRTEHEGVLDQVLQLAHVARPIVRMSSEHGSAPIPAPPVLQPVERAINCSASSGMSSSRRRSGGAPAAPR